MKNRNIDVNNHLFMALERLNDESLTQDQIRLEVERSKGVSLIAGKIIENTRLALDAYQLTLESSSNRELPEQLTCITAKNTLQK